MIHGETLNRISDYHKVIIIRIKSCDLITVYFNIDEIFNITSSFINLCYSNIEMFQNYSILIRQSFLILKHFSRHHILQIQDNYRIFQTTFCLRFFVELILYYLSIPYSLKFCNSSTINVYRSL